MNPISVSKAFHFPKDLPFTEDDHQNSYNNGVKKLMEMLTDLIAFYNGHWFFYNQYKHGLSVGMRPMGNVFNSEQVKQDKLGQNDPYLVVYDNLNLTAAHKKGKN